MALLNRGRSLASRPGPSLMSPHTINGVNAAVGSERNGSRNSALAQRLEVARDPSTLSWDDLLSAARKQGGVEWAGGRAPTSRELFSDVPKELMHDHDHGHALHDHHHHHDHDQAHGHRHTHTQQKDEG